MDLLIGLVSIVNEEIQQAKNQGKKNEKNISVHLRLINVIFAL